VKYRKKPVVVEARRWFREGDDKDVAPYYEGAYAAVYQPCEYCRRDMSEHGKIEAGTGELVVCPGDYIVTGATGEKYPCRPDVFEMTYEWNI
jgi:hypothetical protein